MKSETSKAPFSFHCIICFDAFNLDDRYPVVLPCGHTYVCVQCAKRLDVCMECRRSLYLVIPKPLSKVETSPTPPTSPTPVIRCTPRSRHHQIQAMPAKSPQVEKIPLPLPKNLVMMSLMEAAQRKASFERNPSLDLKKARPGENVDDDESSVTDADIIDSIRLMSSPCGVYAVKEKNGLLVFPLDDDEDNIAVEGDIIKTLDSKLSRDAEHTINGGSNLVRERDCKIQSLSVSKGIKNWSKFLKRVVHKKPVFYAGGCMHATSCIKTTNLKYKTPTGPSGVSYKQRVQDMDLAVEICPTFSTTADKEHLDIQARSIGPPGVLYGQGVNVMDPAVEISLTPCTKAGMKQREMRQKPKTPFKISYGQRVQIVDFKGGVAKLQRGEGFIVADHSQLVKVEGPRGKACEIEGMLWTTRANKYVIKNRSSELEKTESLLLKELDKALLLKDQEPTILEALTTAEDRQDESSVSQDVDNGPAHTTSLRDGVEQYDPVSDTAACADKSPPPLGKQVEEEEEGIGTILSECAKMSGLEYLFTSTTYITFMTGYRNENNDVLKKEVT
mmetsp:Transcript_13772/g.20584  ORF Transcript_13772/g.20584 Transcript_13772/m.20584 type:complete len:559 (-) Transcript_13772:45-1721(-)